MTPGVFFSRPWWKTTLLVLAAGAVMVRLGIWQLDRLDQRRAFNARVSEQQSQPRLDLSGKALTDPGLPGMEYRQVQVTGQYDPAYEVVLRNQVWGDHLGVHVLTPLKIAGSDRAVLVNRGWVPFEDFQSGELAKYREPGPVVVTGILRAAETRPQIGGRADPIPGPGEKALLAWNVANVPAIAAQTPLALLPIYVQQAPEPAWTRMPYRSLPEIELTEGPHLGYALQWFAFAGILLAGYPFYIRRERAMQQQRAGASNLPARTQPEMVKGDKS